MLKIKVGSSWRPWLLRQGNTGKCHLEALLSVRSTAACSKGQIKTPACRDRYRDVQREMFGWIFPLIKRKGWYVPVSGQHREYRYNWRHGTSRARDGRQTACKASYFTKDIFNTSIINLSFGIHSIFHFLTFLFWKWELLEQSCSPSPVTTGSCRM